MDFEPKKFNDIFDEMQNRITGVDDFQVGSVTRTIVESFSYELGLLYQKMKLVYLSAFIDTAEGSNLDQVVAVLGIKRNLPDYATGSVTFNRDKGNKDILIPLGTLVATEDKKENPKKVFQTIEEKVLPGVDATVDVKVKAVVPGKEQDVATDMIIVMPRPVPGIKSVTNKEIVKLFGKQRETDPELRERAKNSLISAGKATKISIENALLSQHDVLDVKVLEKGGEYGVIDVWVDGPKLTETDNKIRITKVIDDVKAAGIYVRLNNATPINVSGIFRIEITPPQNLTPDELSQLEGSVSLAIQEFLTEIKMGEPLLFSRLLKEVVSVNGVENLSDFRIYTDPEGSKGGKANPYLMSDNKITTVETACFKPDEICVAAGDKTLPVDVELMVDGMTKANHEKLVILMKKYTDPLPQGANFIPADFLTKMESSGLTINADTLKLTPRPWTLRSNLKIYNKDPKPKVTGINVSFVEKVEAGKLFAYSSLVEITGALSITIADNTPVEDKLVIKANTLMALTAYLDNLSPEESADFDRLVYEAKQVSGVMDASLDENDFLVHINTEGVLTPQLNRIQDRKIGVRQFEKAQLRLNSFFVSDQIELVTISVGELKLELQKAVDNAEISNLRLELQKTVDKDKINALKLKLQDAIDTVKDNLKTLVANILNHFLDNAKPGDDVDFNVLRTAVENRSAEAPTLLKSMNITARSSADGRQQTSSNTNPVSIHIRSGELARMNTITPSQVILIDK